MWLVPVECAARVQRRPTLSSKGGPLLAHHRAAGAPLTVMRYFHAEIVSRGKALDAQ